MSYHLSLDLAMANIGWVIFKDGDHESHGTFKNPKVTDDVMSDLSYRSEKLFEFCDAITSSRRIDKIIIERPHGARDTKAAKAMGVCAAVCAYLKRTKADIEYVTPMTMKKHIKELDVWGIKNPKELSLKLSKLLSAIQFEDDHQADAFMIYECWRKQT
jgi:Holliday junction resolvasome RuvABC endonuclease subunit